MFYRISAGAGERPALVDVREMVARWVLDV